MILTIYNTDFNGYMTGLIGNLNVILANSCLIECTVALHRVWHDPRKPDPSVMSTVLEVLTEKNKTT